MIIYQARTKDFPAGMFEQKLKVVEFSHENGLVKKYHELFKEIEMTKETFIKNLKERMEGVK